MQVFVGADHRGYEAKELLKEILARDLVRETSEVCDMGPYEYNETDDFNDTAVAVAKGVRENPGARGILLCGSGDGMCIQANRFKRIRAMRCSTEEEVAIAREHDDINVLCLAADKMDEELMRKLVKVFLATEFDTGNENRMRRINRLDEREDYA